VSSKKVRCLRLTKNLNANAARARMTTDSMGKVYKETAMATTASKLPAMIRSEAEEMLESDLLLDFTPGRLLKFTILGCKCTASSSIILIRIPKENCFGWRNNLGTNYVSTRSIPQIKLISE
jgi:hypothetical protein